MEYVARLLEDTMYRCLLEHMKLMEAERIYCRHGLEHLMDVARLGWIMALEQKAAITKEEVYLAALLHDIGRVEEYETGISHAAAGQQLAGEILSHIGYPADQAEVLLAAIGGHRGQETEETDSDLGLAGLLKRADKASRPCFYCEAADTCKWTAEQRNTPEDWQ